MYYFDDDDEDDIIYCSLVHGHNVNMANGIYSVVIILNEMYFYS